MSGKQKCRWVRQIISWILCHVPSRCLCQDPSIYVRQIERQMGQIDNQLDSLPSLKQMPMPGYTSLCQVDSQIASQVLCHVPSRCLCQDPPVYVRQINRQIDIQLDSQADRETEGSSRCLCQDPSVYVRQIDKQTTKGSSRYLCQDIPVYVRQIV